MNETIEMLVDEVNLMFETIESQKEQIYHLEKEKENKQAAAQCKFCHSGKRSTIFKNGIGFCLNSNNYLIAFNQEKKKTLFSFKSNYCPLCGRFLLD